MVFKLKISNHNLTNFIDDFGIVDFGEFNNLCMNDFENSLKKYMRNGERRYKSHYKPGEVNNKFMKDYSKAIQLYSNWDF